MCVADEAKSGDTCICGTIRQATPKTSAHADSRGKHRRCRSVPKVKPQSRQCTPLSDTKYGEWRLPITDLARLSIMKLAEW